VSLGGSNTLKLALTAQEGRSAKRPHQAFLLLKDQDSGLDISYPFSVKDSGKSRVELVSETALRCHSMRHLELTVSQTQKDLPVQFLRTSHPVDAEIVIGSFGTSKAYRNVAFQLSIDRDPNVPIPSSEVERYGKLPEIHHIFKTDPRSPPLLVTVSFLLMVLVSFPILLATVRLFYHGQFYYSNNILVALAWCEPQPPPCGAEVGIPASCRLCRVGGRSGRDLFLVLYLLEPVPDASCCFGSECHCVSQWQPSPERSSGKAHGRAEMIVHHRHSIQCIGRF
jgi:hypothetical protein